MFEFGKGNEILKLFMNIVLFGEMRNFEYVI